MTRSELVQKIVHKHPSLTLHQAEQVVSVFLEEIIRAVTHEERVELRGFGVFQARHRKARTGRNPRTGAPVKVPAKKVPFFRVGKLLKERINH